MNSIPNEVISSIFRYLDLKSYSNVSSVCKNWKNIVENIITTNNLIKTISNLSGTRKIVWERKEQIDCHFANDNFYLIGIKKSSFISPISEDAQKTEIKNSKYHIHYKNNLILNSELKVVIVDDKSGQILNVLDLLEHHPNKKYQNNNLIAFSQPDASGNCLTVDRFGYVFALEISNNQIKFCSLINLPSALKFTTKTPLDKAYFKEVALFLEYLDQDDQKNAKLVVFKNSNLESIKDIPSHFVESNFYVFDKNSVVTRSFTSVGNAQKETLTFYEFSNDSWQKKWQHFSQGPFLLCGDRIVTAFSIVTDVSSEKKIAIHSFDKLGNKSECEFVNPGNFIKAFTHNDLFFISFSKRYYIYDPKVNKILGNYAFQFEAHLNTSRPPVILSDRCLFPFTEVDAIEYTPIKHGIFEYRHVP